MKNTKFKKGIIPWCKGLTKETDVRLKLLGEKSSITKIKLFKEGKLKSYTKGKKWEELYPPEKVREMKEINSKSHKLILPESDICNEYQLGKSVKILSKKYNVSKGPIYRILKNNKICRTIKESQKLLGYGFQPGHKINVGKKNPNYGGLSKEHIKNLMKSWERRPTSYEEKINFLIQKYSLPYKYVGSGEVIINYKNPDFINTNGQKKLIEVFSNFFKKRNYGSIKRYKKIRSDCFSKYGFKTLFLNNNDLLSKDWEEICFNKIKRFDNI